MSVKRSQPIPSLADYVFAEQLGKGTYAVVYRAFRKAPPREVVAIKCVLKSTLSKASVDNLLTEITICKKVKHEFIVELKDFQWDDSYIYLIFEYCSGGELSRYIKSNKRLSENVAQHFLQQIAIALKVLRQHEISHLDLKPQNILLSSIPSKSWKNIKLKIADFGFAQYLKAEDSATSIRGSPLYMAPEILLNYSYDARADLWSVGIILFECIFGKAPFSSETFEKLAEKIKSQQPIVIPNQVVISNNCRNLLTQLLQRDPDQRISFDQFFSHPFIDIEHFPSPESYVKGVKLINEAVEKDLRGEYEKSLNLYFSGLQYLVPIYKWGDGTSPYEEEKQEILRRKIVDYMERAENIKTKCNLVVLSNIDLDEIQKANKLIKESDQFYEANNLKQALDCYNKAFDLILPIVSKLDGKNKNSLYSVVDKWMTKAEDIKKQLTICDKEQRKSKEKKPSKANACDSRKRSPRIEALAYDQFFSNNFTLNDSLFKPTCEVQ